MTDPRDDLTSWVIRAPGGLVTLEKTKWGTVYRERPVGDPRAIRLARKEDAERFVEVLCVEQDGFPDKEWASTLEPVMLVDLWLEEQAKDT